MANSTGYKRRLGSKRSQGIITPKAIRVHKCKCTFRGTELILPYWGCITHMPVKIATPNEFLEKTEQEQQPVESSEFDFDPTMRVSEQAPAQPTQPYNGFKDEVKTGENTSVALTTDE